MLNLLGEKTRELYGCETGNTIDVNLNVDKIQVADTTVRTVTVVLWKRCCSEVCSRRWKQSRVVATRLKGAYSFKGAQKMDNAI